MIRCLPGSASAWLIFSGGEMLPGEPPAGYEDLLR
jgi:hypothetical protein